MDSLSLILAPAAIIAIVQVCKDLGVKGPVLRLLPMLIPVVVLLVQFYFSTSQLPGLIAQGILVGLAAMGVFDAAKAASSVVKE